MTAQDLPVVLHNNQKCYQYTIQEGQGLKDLATIFTATTEDLLDLNPGLERGPEAGKTVFIPVKRGALFHQVQAKETLYALSRIYEVSVDSLMSWNPAAQNGINIGQKILIKNAILPFDPSVPVQNTKPTTAGFSYKLTDTLIKYTVLDNETLYSISKRYMIPTDSLMKINALSSSKVRPGQQLLIPIKQERSTPVVVQEVPNPLPKTNAVFQFPVPKKQQYKIAAFLPFQLDSTSGQNRFVAAAALDYYMGMKLALDSLRIQGLEAEVFVYDEQLKPAALNALLQSDELKSMDLIFSPLQEGQAASVAAFAKAQQIPMVFAVHLPREITGLSPNFITYTPKDDILIEQLASGLHTHFQGSSIVLINSPLPQDQATEQRFIEAFKSPSTAQSKLKLQQTSWVNYKKYKAIGGQVIFVSFSSDRAKVQELLQFASSDSLVMVAGTKDWLDWKELSKQQTNSSVEFIVAVPSYFSYQAKAMVPLHKLYRRKYSADLTKMACLGYDVTYLIGQQLLGKTKSSQGYISKMRLQNRPDGLGIENTLAPVVRFQNGELIELNAQ
ncbi:MAG: LysM peptidoglycan-binding domain-containing protein [Flavobacteriales bacterium]